MGKLKIPPKDLLLPQDVSQIILTLERAYELSESEVKKWFKENYDEYVVSCDLYYEQRNAGKKKPLQIK